MKRNMGSAFVLAVAVGLVTASGCSSETGLLIEVTRSSAGSLADIDHLRVFVGTDSDPGSRTFVEDPGDRNVTLSAGRDLMTDPYRLLLQIGDFGDADPYETDVVVAVVAYRGDQPVGFGVLDAPVRFVDGEVRKYLVALEASADRVRIDPNGCATLLLGTKTVEFAATGDLDCDGDPAAEDCNDRDPTISHVATEVCDNSADDDCDGTIDEISDADQDGVTNCDGDCNDNDAAVHPDAAEICDGVDNDCSGTCDDGFADADGDGYLAGCASVRLEDGSCRAEPPPAADCDDSNTGAEVHPEQPDLCNAQDDDCDLYCDEDIGTQGDDGDGYFTCPGGGPNVLSQPGRTCDTTRSDANESDGWNYPAGPDSCNGDLNDDGQKPTEVRCFVFGSGTCDLGAASCADDLPTCVGAALPWDLPSAACIAYDSPTCAASIDPVACALEAAAPTKIRCTMDFLVPLDDDVVPCASAQVPLPGDGTCVWHSVGVGLGYGVALLTPSSGVAAPYVTVCGGFAQIVHRDGGAYQGEVFLYGGAVEDKVLYQLDISARAVSSCSASPLHCDAPFSP